MKNTKWILALGVLGTALLVGCNAGIIPVQPTSLNGVPNPLPLYDGNKGTLLFPFGLQIWQNSGSGPSCGGQGVSVATNFTDSTSPYSNNRFCLSMTVFNYGACYAFTDWVFLTSNIPPPPAPQAPTPKDFSGGNFSTATFYVRSAPTSTATLASGFSFLQNFPPPPGSPSPSFTPVTLTTSWQPMTITLPPAASVTGVGIIMAVEGLGPVTNLPYTMYMDNLQFQ